MLDGQVSCEVYGQQVPIFEEALHHADEFLLTAAGQRNRNHLEGAVDFHQTPFALEEILLDPQTSGGLLAALAPEDGQRALAALQAQGIPAQIVGRIKEKDTPAIHVI